MAAAYAWSTRLASVARAGNCAVATHDYNLPSYRVLVHSGPG